MRNCWRERERETRERERERRERRERERERERERRERERERIHQYTHKTWLDYFKWSSVSTLHSYGRATSAAIHAPAGSLVQGRGDK